MSWATHAPNPLAGQVTDSSGEPPAVEVSEKSETSQAAAASGESQPAGASAASEAGDAGPSAGGMGIPTGIRRYVPGAWGAVSVDLSNPTSRPVELLVTSYLDGDKDQQFGRRIWVPPYARRSSWYPIRIPEITDRERNYVEIGSLMQDTQLQATGDEVLMEKPAGRLTLDQTRVVTGLMVDQSALPGETDWIYEAVVAARTSQQQTRQLSILDLRALPPTPETLEGLDQLVLASRQLGDHPAFLRAVRTWLSRGGRMWVMLDQVDPDGLARLLGERMSIDVVDRVELTSLKFESTNPSPFEKPEVREFEEPVEMVRVLLSEGHVTHVVDGWPAAFWIDVGQGKLLVTTVGAREWLRVRTATDPQPRSLLHECDYAPREPLLQLAGDLFSPWQGSSADRPQVLPYLSEHIGYRTLPRAVLVGILGGFCLLVLGAAVTFGRQGHAERLAPIVAVAALLAVAVIVGLGWATRSAVPPSLASFQLVRTLPDPSEVDIQGTLGLYNPTPLDDPLEVERGGVIWPDTSGLEGTTRRVVFTDLDRYHWQNLRLPPGVRTADLRFTASLDSPLLASASFDESGLFGRLVSGDFSDTSDAVIATRSGRLIAVRLQADGTFTAAAGSVLDRGQFTDSGILSDEQRRRRDIFAQMLEPARSSRLINRPTLLVWAAARPLPLSLPDTVQRTGASLLLLPLSLTAPPADSAVVVPSPLVEMQSVAGLQGQSLSSSYNNLNRQWLPQVVPSELHLQFFVPEVLRGMQVERATLRLELNCPSRKLEIVGFDGSEPLVLRTYDSPVGVITWRITEPRALHLDENGRLLLGLYIDRGLSTENDTEWRIEDVQLELAGRAAGN